MQGFAPPASLGSAPAYPDLCMLHIQLIGTVKFWGNERALATRPQLRKATAILAILALTDEHDISRRQLARLLWSRKRFPGPGSAARYAAPSAPCARYPCARA
jgi:hypothetical protein